VKILFAVMAWGICSCVSAWAQVATAATAAPTTIMWNGLVWNVKSGTGKDPGFNSWSPDNVFVDASGDLHLALTNVGGTWNCAEAWTDVAFGFGTFQWQLATAVDNLDPNVVLGLFVYGPPALGPDGTHEIDIEYARFGSATADIGRWTIFPNVKSTPPLLGRSSYALSLGGAPATTSRFTWAPSNIAFATLGGFQPAGSSANTIHSWTFQPIDPGTTISQSPMPLHMNLWLNHGLPPTNGQNVEIVIHSFSFTPTVGALAIPALPGTRAIVLALCVFGVGMLWLRRFTWAFAINRSAAQGKESPR
jgi:hypothetical protein